MKYTIRRRDFIKKTTAGGIGLGLAGNLFNNGDKGSNTGGRIGIIGLDTSHSTAFTNALNKSEPDPVFGGFRVVAAYPRGSKDIISSTERIPAYTEAVKKLGVEIVDSIDELLDKVDYVMLETNDGRLHLDQAIKVMKSGKRMFIDKPIAASLTDTFAIFEASKKFNSSLFSSSSLRYIAGVDDIAQGKIGKVMGADTYSPATIEVTHPDLFWYGVHGVEILFTVMGTGCKSVVRTSSDDTDVVTGKWNDGRIGTFRGLRAGKKDYGGTVFGETGVLVLGKYSGYNSLLAEIIKFFQTGVLPVNPAETIEIFAFMAAAQLSKEKDGSVVLIEELLNRAMAEAKKIVSDII